MIFIVESKKYGKHEILIDDEDYVKIKNYKWCISKKNNSYYIKNRKHEIYLHRLLLNINIKHQIVDHINGNTLDNRKENLRVCSHKENMRNVKKRTNNTSGYKGVYLRKENGKYFAQIRVDKKTKKLGDYFTKDQAAIAYNIAALKYFGEFAKLNNIMCYRHEG